MKKMHFFWKKKLDKKNAFFLDKKKLDKKNWIKKNWIKKYPPFN